MELQDRIERALGNVQKPVRYIGGEYGSASKDVDSVAVRYAFLFPDTYEVGMSHLGMRILYDILNKREDVFCERVFTPWVDMAAQMRENDIPLFTLETRTPVREFDLLGITLQYEMSFTNILESLDLAGIPLRSADRGEGDPFVICGGPCAFNAEPLAPFVDLIALGDGEEETLATVDVYKAWKASGLPRAEYLRMAAKIPGIYVPSLYDVEYNADGTVKSISPKPGSGAPETVRKALVKDLNAADYPEKLIVPFGEIVHNRIMLEIFRGCTRGCRFCQAGMLYRPVRERRIDRLMALADKLVDSTGYDEISLMSLSSGDYSCLPELAHRMVERFAARRVKISLPSQRIDAVLTDTLKETQKVRKTALTLAPEAGTQRLRDVINKGVTEEDLTRAVTDAFEQGWSAVKLYFMIGLPTETDEDVLGIAELARKVRSCYFALPKEKRAPGLRITVSASVFVPKNFTPFEWAAQLDLETVQRRQQLLKDELRKIKGVDFKYHDGEVSLIEAVFARGDRRLSEVLERAWRKGCRFDGWSDQFRYDLWLEAFEEAGLSPAFYALREREETEFFPWDHLDAGVTKEFLLREYRKARRGETTQDCRKGCVGCGMKRFEGACTGCEAAAKDKEQASPELPARTVPDGHHVRMMIRFGKTARLRFTSHLDLQRFLHMAMARTGLPILYSQGFNPHPQMAFGSALALGWTSQYELLDVKLSVPMGRKRCEEAVRAALPEDLPVYELKLIDERAPSLMSRVYASDYRIELSGEGAEDVVKAIPAFIEREEIPALRKTKSGEREVNIRPLVLSLEGEGNVIRARLKLTEKESLKADLLIEKLLELAGVDGIDMRIERSCLYGLDENGEPKPMMEL